MWRMNEHLQQRVIIDFLLKYIEEYQDRVFDRHANNYGQFEFLASFVL